VEEDEERVGLVLSSRAVMAEVRSEIEDVVVVVAFLEVLWVGWRWGLDVPLWGWEAEVVV
jgi:hypothetical protein